MKDFLLRKFEIEYNSIQSLIRSIEDQEEQIPEYSLKGISHIINVHHIWNCHLIGKKSESNVWDVFPVHFLQKLNTQNFQETYDYIEKQELNSTIHYVSKLVKSMETRSEDVLFHILQHCSYHRGQIIQNMKTNRLKVPSNQFVQLAD